MGILGAVERLLIKRLSRSHSCYRRLWTVFEMKDPQKLNQTAALAVKDYLLPIQILPPFPNRTFVCALAIDPQDISPLVQAAYLWSVHINEVRGPFLTCIQPVQDASTLSAAVQICYQLHQRHQQKLSSSGVHQMKRSFFQLHPENPSGVGPSIQLLRVVSSTLPDNRNLALNHTVFRLLHGAQNLLLPI